MDLGKEFRLACISKSSTLTLEKLGSRVEVKPTSSMDGGEVSEADGGKQRKRSIRAGRDSWAGSSKKRGPGAFRLVCSGRSWAQEEVGQVP